MSQQHNGPVRERHWEEVVRVLKVVNEELYSEIGKLKKACELVRKVKQIQSYDFQKDKRWLEEEINDFKEERRLEKRFA